MSRSLGLVTLLVDDYGRAIEWFTKMLGFKLLTNQAVESDKRWVVVAPESDASAGLLLARAADTAQRDRIGNQTGGRVAFFLYSDDFERDYSQMQARGVHFIEAVRRESYGRVCVFEDLYGNRWDLLEQIQ